jgi:hypothetical protein
MTKEKRLHNRHEESKKMLENGPSMTDEVFHASGTVLWKSILAQREQNVERGTLAWLLDDATDKDSCCAPI